MIKKGLYLNGYKKENVLRLSNQKYKDAHREVKRVVGKVKQKMCDKKCREIETYHWEKPVFKNMKFIDSI